jgi:hypothetical protein
VEGLELEATRRGRRGDSVKSGCLGWVSGFAVCEEENRRVWHLGIYVYFNCLSVLSFFNFFFR